MAHLTQKPSGVYYLRFRIGAESFNRSLKTTLYSKAERILHSVENTLSDLERGRLQPPVDCDLGDFILSDGRISTKSISKNPTLTELIDRYFSEMPTGHQEQTSLQTLKYHSNHLKRVLKRSTRVSNISNKNLQQYINVRSADKYRGTLISSKTIRKEVETLKFIWTWGIKFFNLKNSFPGQGLKYPKQKSRPPFQTWDQITNQIQSQSQSQSLTAAQEKELWECLFLDLPQVEQLLDFVLQKESNNFRYPMFVLVAHTGMRRSEIVRVRVEDVNFEAGTILAREKKKDKSKDFTFRSISMSSRLQETLKDWLTDHPGGNLLHQDSVAITIDQSTHHFKQCLKHSKWKVVRGFHVFRHSFASNLARNGIDERVIDELMGHQTEEMRRRYRHLFPQQARSVINSVFG